MPLLSTQVPLPDTSQGGGNLVSVLDVVAIIASLVLALPGLVWLAAESIHLALLGWAQRRGLCQAGVAVWLPAALLPATASRA